MNKDYILMQKKSNIHFLPNAYVIGRVYSHTMNELVGSTFGPTLALYDNGVMNWYASKKGLADASKRGFELVKAKPEVVKESLLKFNSLASELLSFTSGFFNADLTQKSNEELWQIMAEYLSKYEKAYLYSEPLVLCLNDSLSQYLENYLKFLTGSSKNANDYFNLLISTRQKSFVKEEEDALYQIAVKLRRGEIAGRSEMVEEHEKKYFWIPYDYGMYTWTKEYFNKVLDKMLEEKDIEEKLTGSERYFRELAEKQDKLEHDLDIDEYHRALFSAMRDATFLLDHKKEIFTQIHFHCAKLLEEIGKRLGITKELTQYYWPEELEAALVRGESLSKLKLTRRYKRCLAYWHNSVCLLKSGIAAEKFLQLHIKPEGISPTVIDGIIASAGRYEGRVKVVLTAVEIAKVERGDILVAPMTSPDYVPAMRRAGAIITDEGGVMCHAAIVSRELGVPCVVGTKNATEILHDGDIVEVNANHNSVRIVKK